MPTWKCSKDHLGNEYPSILAMCNHYNIVPATYRARIEHGWSIEDALTKTTANNRGRIVKDHLGNEYPSVNAMCKHYNIIPATYRKYIKKGYSVKDALIKCSHHKNIVKDHLGNEYPSVNAMCKHYNIDRNTRKRRIRAGWSVKDTLTKPIAKNCTIKDHLGNEYPSVAAMCRHYGLNVSTYKNRIKTGWSIHDTLTKTAINTKGFITKDHLGNEYPSVNAMCKHYNIDREAYCKYIRRGYSIENAIIKCECNRHDTIVKDHLGNEYPSVVAMCRHYNINNGTYKSRISKGWSIKNALLMTAPPITIHNNNHTLAIKNKYNNTPIQKVIFDGKETFWTMDMICDFNYRAMFKN